MYSVDDLLDRIKKRIEIEVDEGTVPDTVDFTYALSSIYSLFRSYTFSKLPIAVPDEEGVVSLTWTRQGNVINDVILAVSDDIPNCSAFVRYVDKPNDWIVFNSSNGLPDLVIKNLFGDCNAAT